MSNYDGKEFNDPILRCTGCTKIVHRAWISARGGCNHCGNRRFQNINGFDDDEYNQLVNGTYDLGMKEYKIDPDFFKLFEQSEAI